ncbi:MAG: tRNA lysidine(34) synthetase TilS [Gammaproteobacteria bacterium]
MCNRTVIDSLSLLPRDTLLCLAFSGGMDSTVLLHALKQAQVQFSVYHINHGLSPHADAWAEQITALCNALSIPITCITLTTKPAVGESVEAWAREARYAALIEAIPANRVLLTAHHEGDQAETVLLQLMRGAGPKGLSGIAPIKRLCRKKNIHVHRPLLSVSKKAIEAYAKEHALTWVEDESNVQLRFERNFMRHEALPLLASRVPHVMESLARSASHLQEQQALVEMFVSSMLPSLQGSKPGTLSIERLLALPEITLKAVLRHWLGEHDVRMPSPKKLETIITTVLKAAEDAQPRVCIDEHVIVRYRDTLYIVSQEQLRSLSDYHVEWDPREELCLPHGAGTLCADDLTKAGIDVAEGEKVHVRFRQGGETVFVPGVGHQPLKKWFQSHDIPVWERERVPLVYLNGIMHIIL